MGCSSLAAHPSNIHPLWHPEVAGFQRVKMSFDIISTKMFKLKLTSWAKLWRWWTCGLRRMPTYPPSPPILMSRNIYHWGRGVTKYASDWQRLPDIKLGEDDGWMGYSSLAAHDHPSQPTCLPFSPIRKCFISVILSVMHLALYIKIQLNLIGDIKVETLYNSGLD